MPVLHERVGRVNKAKSAIEYGFLQLCAGDAVLERVCAMIARVELLCLRASDMGTEPRPPWPAPERRLWELVTAERAQHGLTWGETARIVHHLSDAWLNFIIRWERHGPDSDKKADEA